MCGGAPPPQGPAGPQTWNRGPGDRWRQEGGGPDRWHDHGPPQGGPHWTPHRYPPIYRSPERFRAWAWEPPAGWYARSWRYGERLPRAWLTPDDFIDDWWDFGLPEAPPGYAWIRIGGDALLIDAYDGRIVQVVQDVFW